MVLPKTKSVYEKNTSDIKIVLNVLACFEKCLDRLDRTHIIDDVLPLLYDVRLQDPEIILRVVSKCYSYSWHYFFILYIFFNECLVCVLTQFMRSRFSNYRKITSSLLLFLLVTCLSNEMEILKKR